MPSNKSLGRTRERYSAKFIHQRARRSAQPFGGYKMPPLLLAAAITAVDLALFGAFLAGHAVAVREFPIMEGLISGGYVILWRVMYVQAPLQLLLMWALFKTRFGNNLAVTLGAAVGALIVSAALFSQGFSSVLPLFGASFTQHLNEGIVLIASVTVAWGLLVGLRRVDVAA